MIKKLRKKENEQKSQGNSLTWGIRVINKRTSFFRLKGECLYIGYKLNQGTKL